MEFKKVLLTLGCALVATTSLAGTERLKAKYGDEPMAKPIENIREYHGIKLSDPWYWLQDSSYPNTDDKEILDYLKAENTYYDKFKQEQQQLINTVFEEFKGRTDNSEKSVPWQTNGYEYRWEYKPGDNYRTFYRKDLKTGSETIVLDEPKLAKAHKYFRISGLDISPDNKLMAISVDTSGDERYEIHFKDLSTGKWLDTKLTDANGSVKFTGHSDQILYGKLEPKRWYTRSINLHTLGQNQAHDKVIVTETDDSYSLGFGKTRDNQFITIISGRSDATEVSVMPADLSKPLKQMVSRDQKARFSVRHAHGKFYIMANDTHVNFRLAVVDDKAPEYKNWKTLIAGSDKEYLQQVVTYDKFIAIKKSIDGLERIVIRDYQGKEHNIDFPETVYGAYINSIGEFAQPFVRIGYQSMVTPSTTYDYHVVEKKLETRKVTQIPSGYDKSQYETKRIMADARDGARVPVTLLYPKGMKLDGSNPVHLYGYGAYSAGMSPRFSIMNLSLVDRGFVYALAHIRGGDEMGYQWYLDGKMKKRTNTFNDFVDVAKHLIKTGYTSEGNISISGRSAGGELVGAAVIQAPELWRSAHLGVPFVDVLNTMLNAELPLTPKEWDEWGNPIKNKDDFELIQSYSPYDNIAKRDYPPMFVSGGLNDPRVTYWEPAKWTAKMRHFKTDDNLLIMRMNMGAGHFANSGRYGRLKDEAEVFAFILAAHGINK